MSPLIAVRIVHTVVWAFFAGCILVVPVLVFARRIDLALLFNGIVLLEVLILVFNRLRCPLTGVAARYTDDRRANFDIYLPEWLARNNKAIFGALYAAGVLLTVGAWLGWLA